MSSNKWRSVFSDGLTGWKWERQIVLQFQRAYIEAKKPKNKALFNFTPLYGHGLYMTPDSVQHCDELLALMPWNESNPLPTNGPCGWLAGDESLKP